MSPASGLLATLACLALPPALPSDAPPPAPREVSAGEPVPPLKLRTLLGGDGRTTLEAYRGSPVLFAWYSTVPAGMNGAPRAVDLALEHGEDGLVVILMEIKNHDPVYLRALQMKKLPGAPCPLLKNQKLPFAYDDTTGPPPKVALVGVDGTLLFAGSYQQLGRVEKLIEAELNKRKQGWGEHPTARAARSAAYGASQLGRAHLLLQEAVQTDPGQPELSAATQELEARFDSWKSSVAYLREQGELRRARDSAAALAASTEGHATWGPEAQELAASFETAELQAQLKLEQKLDKLLKPLRKKDPKKGLGKKLRKFADAAGDSPLATRARTLADAADYAVEEL